LQIASQPPDFASLNPGYGERQQGPIFARLRRVVHSGKTSLLGRRICGNSIPLDAKVFFSDEPAAAMEALINAAGAQRMIPACFFPYLGRAYSRAGLFLPMPFKIDLARKECR
jgi:hypothetical protein